MQRLRTFPPPRALLILFLLATAVSLLLLAPLRALDGRMQAHGYGIVDFELTFGAGTAAEILTAWGAVGRNAARASTRLDFAFIPAYALAFAALTLLLARRQRGFWEEMGLWLSAAPLPAAALDVVENLFLLGMLHRPVDFPPAFALLASVAAAAKFALLVAPLAYWTALLLRAAARRLRR